MDRHKTYKYLLILILMAFWLNILAASLVPHRKPFGNRADVQAFIHDMVQNYHFNQKKLTALFNTVPYRDEVVYTIKHEYKLKPWFEFNKAFLNQQHVDDGVKYWQAHKKILNKAEKIYHVPPQIIVAIIGVESNYGCQTGKFKVLESLTNLAFNKYDRTNFFKLQLQEFLLLCREKHMDPHTIMGSYAGAIGQLQFMPQIVRSYAVDFDNDGKIDLSHNSADVIGSVANFFNKHGWQENAKIAVPAKKTTKESLALSVNTLQNQYSLVTLKQNGIVPKEPIKQKTNLGIIQLQQEHGEDYWIGLNNLYVITHYNTDVKYGMVVMLLGEQIKRGM